MKKEENIIIVFLLITFWTLCTGCENKNREKVPPVITQTAKQLQNIIKDENTNKKTEKPVAQKTDAALSKVIKEMDDFSAALGLQYARFNYDTNFYLLDYTNVIVKLTDEEFLDFIRGYLKAHNNGINNAELTQFRELLLQRLKSVNNKNVDVAGDIFRSLAFTFTPKYCGKADYNGLNQITQKALSILDSDITDSNKKELQISFLENAVTASGVMLMYSLKEKQPVNDDIIKIIDDSLSKEKFSDEQQNNLKYSKSCVLMISNPRKAQKELPELINSWHGKKDLRYKACVAALEAFEKGLQGEAVSRYVKNKIFSELKAKVHTGK